MSKEQIYKVSIPEGVQVNIEGRTVKVKGPKGELERIFFDPNFSITKDNENVLIKFIGTKFTRNHKAIMGTFESHIKNLIKGSKDAYHYTLKICSGHFPMNVNIESGVLTIKNFLGEKVPRKIKLVKGVDVKIEGDIINVRCVDKEKAGKVASLIEGCTRITNRDRRVFQDGIYLISKGEEW